jgi:Na+-transporting NADH:ubiquinone oxidoreductase subunit NqrB
MKRTVSIRKKMAANLLFVILMFPTIFNFIHHFGDHQHIECSENKSHIHQSIANCDICDFNLLTFNYDVNNTLELQKVEIIKKANTIFGSLKFHSFTITNKQLRAPPILS